MKKILVFGTFDVLHPGHYYFLQRAKSYGDKLFIVLARDKTIEEVKARKPANNELARKEALEKLPYVDKVVLGKLGNKYDVIDEIKPDVICLGYDQKTFVDKLEEELAGRKLNPKIIRIPNYREDIYKSSKMKV